MNLKLIHIISVALFLVLYIVKLVLLLMNKNEGLDKLTRITKVPEMIISTVFLVTGIWMFAEIKAIKTLQIIKLAAVFASIPLAIVGFKKRNKAIASLAVFLIIMSYGFAEMARKKPYIGSSSSNEQAAPGAAVDGAALYVTNCGMCHGEDGKKGLSGAIDLSISSIDQGSVEIVIKEGRGGMAGYKDVLSAEEITAIAAHVMTLRK